MDLWIWGLLGTIVAFGLALVIVQFDDLKRWLVDFFGNDGTETPSNRRGDFSDPD